MKYEKLSTDKLTTHVSRASIVHIIYNILNSFHNNFGNFLCIYSVVLYKAQYACGKCLK